MQKVIKLVSVMPETPGNEPLIYSLEELNAWIEVGCTVISITSGSGYDAGNYVILVDVPYGFEQPEV